MTGSTARRVVLGIRLRRLREQAGLTQQKVADVCGWSTKKLIRMERGQSAQVSVGDVGFLANLYGGVDPADLKEMSTWARESRIQSQGWWTGFSSATSLYMGLEADAGQLRIWNPLMVPGLLQTREYAESVIAMIRPQLSGPEVERQVDLRLRRQKRVGRDILIQALIDESVLLRRVGGPGVMRSQLEYLLAASRRQGVDLRVVPLEAGVATTGAVTLIALSEGIELAYTEGVGGDVILDNVSHVAEVSSRFELLLSVAQSVAASRATLSKRIS